MESWHSNIMCFCDTDIQESVNGWKFSRQKEDVGKINLKNPWKKCMNLSIQIFFIWSETKSVFFISFFQIFIGTSEENGHEDFPKFCMQYISL